MSPAAWLFLVLVCGFVWGGFALLLGRALRSERWKGEHPEGGSHGDGATAAEHTAAGRRR